MHSQRCETCGHISVDPCEHQANAPPTQYWWEDPGEIATLLEWMWKRGDMSESDFGAMIEVLRKPWHWDSEHAEMVRGDK